MHPWNIKSPYIYLSNTFCVHSKIHIRYTKTGVIMKKLHIYRSLIILALFLEFFNEQFSVLFYRLNVVYIRLINKKQQHQHFVKTLCIFNEAAKVTYFSYKFSIVTKTIL